MCLAENGQPGHCILTQHLTLDSNMLFVYLTLTQTLNSNNLGLEFLEEEFVVHTCTGTSVY